jgi:hypothetical protein
LVNPRLSDVFYNTLCLARTYQTQIDPLGSEPKVEERTSKETTTKTTQF